MDSLKGTHVLCRCSGAVEREKTFLPAAWQASIMEIPAGVSRERLVVSKPCLFCPHTRIQNILQRHPGFANEALASSRPRHTHAVGAVRGAHAPSRSRGSRPFSEAMMDAVARTAANQREKRKRMALQVVPYKEGLNTILASITILYIRSRGVCHVGDVGSLLWSR